MGGVDQPEFSEIFELDRGYRFKRDRVSILVKMIALGRSLTEQRLFSLADATNEYFDSVAGETHAPAQFAPTMTSDFFPERDAGRLFKFIEPQVWRDHISKGDFRLGALKYYRDTENEQIRDRCEGASQITLSWQGREIHFAVEAGENCVVFCGTNRKVSARRTMSERFGKMVIEIIDPHTFAERVCQKIGAVRYTGRGLFGRQGIHSGGRFLIRRRPSPNLCGPRDER